MDSPPDPQCETSGKRSDARHLVRDQMLQHFFQIYYRNMMQKEYIGTVQSDKSSKVKDTRNDVYIYFLLSSGSDV